MHKGGETTLKIIIAPDSFKGSMDAIDVAKSIEKGVKRVLPRCETLLLPVGDGGEGTLEVLIKATGGEIRTCHVKGPRGDMVEAKYGILGNRNTCVIEMSTASGLNLTTPGSREILKASSYGTGELILNALNDGLRDFIITLGGSATNDGGLGMLSALGLKAVDSFGNELKSGGGDLSKIVSIDNTTFDKRIHECNFIIASDVQNPFIGSNGATRVFGPQKEAKEEEIERLEKGMKNWADVIYEHTDTKIHEVAGAGAAGGLGGALHAFFPSEIKSGIDFIIDIINLEEHLQGADLVITGEGRVDNQTFFGKTPLGVAKKANKENVPTIIIAGSVGEGIESLGKYGVIGVYSIINEPMTLIQAIRNTSKLLENIAYQITYSLFYESSDAYLKYNQY